MKPQLITDLSGVHNKNLDTSKERIIKGATWKKQRIVVIIPAGDNIPAKVALNLWNLIFPPNQQVVRILAQGMEVGEAYSAAIGQVSNHPELKNWEYILTVEHDNIPPSDGVLKLIQRMEEHPELSCIGGLYWTKGEGGVPQIWGDVKDPQLNFRPQPPVANELVECCGTGMGFNLWRISMFKDERIKKPFFKTLSSANGVGTQDLSFWTEARKYGYRCAIDCGVLVGHYSVNEDIVW